MLFYAATLAIGSACWLYFYFRKRARYFEELGVPYYPAWPIADNACDFFMRKRHISELVKDVYNLNPDAKWVGAFDVTRPIYVLRDPELIRNVAITNFDCFTDHRVYVDDTTDPLIGGMLLNINGERWKKMRNLLSPAFTSSKMKGMFELMAECARNFVGHLAERSDETNRVIDTKDLFSKLTNDVIAACAFGLTVNSLRDPANEFFLLGREGTDMNKLKYRFLFAILFPRLTKWFKVKIVKDRVANFFTNIVEKTVKMREETGVTRPDMIQLMMDARDKNDENFKLDIGHMTAQAFIFFFGGFDTTSTEMCVLSHELAVNPDIQRRLQDEIDEVLKETDGKLTYEAIMAMPYLEAVIQESLRRHCQLPILNRVCTRSFELPAALPGGRPITLRPGDYVWIPSAAIHSDPKYYENPDRFDPERFLNKKVTTNQPTNLGFGIGPRGCIGNRFALMETKILTFLLLAEFNLKPNERTSVPLEYSKKDFFIRVDGGFWLTFEKRR